MPLRKRGRVYGSWDTIPQMKQLPGTADGKRTIQALMMVTLITVLAAGVFAGWMSMREEDGYMRSELLRQARLFAETVNMGGIHGLKGDASDLSRPEYRRLKDQFAAAADTFRGSRFLYLVGRRPGGDVFFTWIPGSPDPRMNRRQARFFRNPIPGFSRCSKKIDLSSQDLFRTDGGRGFRHGILSLTLRQAGPSPQSSSTSTLNTGVRPSGMQPYCRTLSRRSLRL